MTIMYFATEEGEKQYNKSMASTKKVVENLQTCIAKHGDALQRSLSELESLDSERSRKWQTILQLERDQRLCLENMVKQLAQQLGGLQQAAKVHSIPVRDSSKCFKHSKMHEGNVPISGFRGDVCE
jgi:chromosome segregation ATPase